MPNVVLLGKRSELVGLRGISIQRRLDEGICPWDDPDAVLSCISNQLAKPFGVSTDVVERRVEGEKLWSPDIEG